MNHRDIHGWVSWATLVVVCVVFALAVVLAGRIRSNADKMDELLQQCVVVADE